MSTTQMKNNKEDTILEEEENGFYCFHRKKELHEKPWIIVDYPEDEKRFQLKYLLLSHVYNSRIKVKIQFDINQIIESMNRNCESNQ